MRLMSVTSQTSDREGEEGWRRGVEKSMRGENKKGEGGREERRRKNVGGRLTVSNERADRLGEERRGRVKETRGQGKTAQGEQKR